MLREIWVLYIRELREAFRERTILINSVLIPIVMYPLLLWFMFTAITYAMGRTEGFVSRVHLHGATPAAEAIREELEEADDLALVVEPADPAEAAAWIREGRLDALLEVLPPEADAEVVGNYRARVTFDSSKDRSQKARDRLRGRLYSHRNDWLEEEASEYGISSQGWTQFLVERKNVASTKQMGGLIMGLMLPLFLVICIALAAFYPAVDATAGERERGTWETLMSTAASRKNIVTAKYLYVATMGAMGGLLNLLAMAVSMKSILGPLMRDTGEAFAFDFPIQALPVMFLGTVLLALFIAAGMMIFASFARTFKEGQSLITPFYLVIIVPCLLVNNPEYTLTPALALVPVANLVLVFREAIQSKFNFPLIGLSILVEGIIVFLCLRLAGMILRFEDVFTGSYEGNILSFVKNRLLKRKDRTPPEGERK